MEAEGHDWLALRLPQGPPAPQLPALRAPALPEALVAQQPDLFSVAHSAGARLREREAARGGEGPEAALKPLCWDQLCPEAGGIQQSTGCPGEGCEVWGKRASALLPSRICLRKLR